MKRLLRRSVLGGLTLAAVLCFPLRATLGQAQSATGTTQSAANSAATAKPDAANSAETPSAEKNQQTQEGDDQFLKSPSVVWLGKKLGIGTDHASMMSDVGNFVLLALGIAWILVKILPKAFRDRNTTIQKNLKEAQTATEEAHARLSSVEERLSKLDGEIAAMHAQSEQSSAKEEKDIKGSVEKEKKAILAAAEQEIATATAHAQKQLQRYAAGLAIEQAAQKLTISADTDRLLVQGFAQKLTDDGSKKGQN